MAEMHEVKPSASLSLRYILHQVLILFVYVWQEREMF